MPDSLHLSQLARYADILAEGRVVDFYNTLHQHGYSYANWAGSFAQLNQLVGDAPLDYLHGTALMGLQPMAGPHLNPEAAAQWIRDLADGYLRVLMELAVKGAGTVARDIDFSEAVSIYQRAFKKQGMAPSSWCLGAALEVVIHASDAMAAEAQWARFRATTTGSWSAMWESARLLRQIGRLTQCEDENTRDMAIDWIDRGPGKENWYHLERFLDAHGILY